MRLGGEIIKNAYKVGMYIRLSREDEEKNDESESITNQRSFILDYLKENGYTLYDEYVDDGRTGTNFDRPAFKRMIRDIEQGKINMVVTKDMSRLGRDYVGFGHYIEKYFPEHNVRYIAITDDVDTFTDNIGNDMVPFKAIFNDMYAKDISKKVKASLVTKKKQGLFLGTFAPYGYIKDPNDKYKLVIDPGASEVVKRIYKMFIEGSSIHKIAQILTTEKVQRPSVRMHMKNKDKVITKDIWDKRTLWDILKNPNYTGNMYQNKYKKVNYKSKKLINVPQEKWIVAYNTHEPIIDIKTFDLAQSILEKNKLLHKKPDTLDILLRGFMFCKECGHTIGINPSGTKGKYFRYTVCNHYRKHSKMNFCTNHSMRYDAVEEMVLNKVRELCNEYIDTTKFETIIKNNSKRAKAIADINQRILKYKKLIEENTNHIYNSYMDRLKNIITIEMYQGIAENLSKEISINQKLIAELETEQQALTDNKGYNDNEQKEMVRNFLSLKNPDRSLLANIIDKIVIDKDKNIEIYYKIKSMKFCGV